MEMAEQETQVEFTQMLQMFPNIPHDIVWMYVQRYSSDIEKCAQMLNLQSGKYTGISSFALDNDKYLNGQDVSAQPSHAVIDNNVVHSSFTNEAIKNMTNGDIKQVEFPAISPLCESGKFAKFQRTQALYINVDDDESGLHSWRPSLPADVVCSDFFLPSHMLENFQLDSNHVSNMNFQRSISQFHVNPEAVTPEIYSYNTTPVNLYHGCPLQNERAYGVDIADHLRFQKSQMNAIRYEVIKAKIELSALIEAEEKLISELKELMQSKNAQDIENLTEEIVQLRLECQCMCTEVDCSQKNPVLLGVVNEKCHVGSHSSSILLQEIQSRPPNASSAAEEPQRWPCPQCTFANHPAMGACKICQVRKSAVPRQLPPYPPPPATCYCHPKEESLSIRS